MQIDRLKCGYLYLRINRNTTRHENGLVAENKRRHHVTDGSECNPNIKPIVVPRFGSALGEGAKMGICRGPRV